MTPEQVRESSELLTQLDHVEHALAEKFGGGVLNVGCPTMRANYYPAMVVLTRPQVQAVLTALRTDIVGKLKTLGVKTP